MTITAENILKTLGYFDLFQYPLTRDEIYLFYPEHVSPPVVFNELGAMVNDKSIYIFDELYSLQNDPALSQRRRNGNLLAVEQMKIAVKVSKFLSGFPYVKGIAVSGSLSKNFATENSDIDFFVITAANRLWIARTFMHLYKKLTFLTGKQHWFCMNYYVDEAALEIPEKNVFTAMEIVTLVPMEGKTSIENFISSNHWTKVFFPLYNSCTANAPEIKAGLWRKLTEKILNGNMGNALDNKLMKITGKRWKKKTEKQLLNSRGIVMGMLLNKHFSKPDPANFQDKVVEQYEAKVAQLLQQQNKVPVVIA